MLASFIPLILYLLCVSFLVILPSTTYNNISVNTLLRSRLVSAERSVCGRPLLLSIHIINPFAYNTSQSDWGLTFAIVYTTILIYVLFILHRTPSVSYPSNDRLQNSWYRFNMYVSNDNTLFIHTDSDLYQAPLGKIRGTNTRWRRFNTYHCRLTTLLGREQQHFIQSYRFRSVSGSAWQNSWYRYMPTSFQHVSLPPSNTLILLAALPPVSNSNTSFIYSYRFQSVSGCADTHSSTPPESSSFVSSCLPLLCPASPSTIYFSTSILQRRHRGGYRRQVEFSLSNNEQAKILAVETGVSRIEYARIRRILIEYVRIQLITCVFNWTRAYSSEYVF